MSHPSPYQSPNQSGWNAPPSPDGYSARYAQMGMGEAVSSVLSKYATFSGRARRSEFWWFFLAQAIVGIVAASIDAAVFQAPVLQWIVTLGLLIPNLAVGARRLHDTGRSGWWQLIALVPLVGVIVLIVFFAQDGHPNSNQHGPSPKYQATGGY